MKKYVFLLLPLLVFSCSSRADYPADRIVSPVTVEYERGVFIVSPGGSRTPRAFIFYPGGRVDPDAYLPLAALIAREAEITVFIPRMPFNLAVLKANKAGQIIEREREYTTWYLGGHSLGGAMASAFIHDNPDRAAGLILLAAYPLEKKPLTNYEIPVLSITASEDGLINREDMKRTTPWLPPDTVFYTIQGGNHAQFGSYGDQKGDNPALIGEEEQQSRTALVIADFLTPDRQDR